MGNTFSRGGKRKNEWIPPEGKNEKKENKWIKAASYPSHIDIESHAMVLNEGQFLFRAGNMYNGHGEHFLLKYNVRLDQWTQFISLPPGCFTQGDFGVLDAQVDQRNNRVFFVEDILDRVINPDLSQSICYGTTLERTSVVDLHTGLLIYRICRERKYKINYSIHCASMVNVDGVMHRINGPHHSIWNETKVDWEPIRMSPEFLELNLRVHPRDYSLVHVPSKKILLMIGGFQKSDRMTTGVWRYGMSSGIWEEMKDEDSNSFRFHGGVVDSVLSSNERYVIIAVARYVKNKSKWGFYEENEFHFLDIENNGSYKLRKSSLTLPDVEGASRNGSRLRTMTTTGGLLESKLLISGWLRKQRASENVPLDIMRLISEWCSKDIIRLHCFKSVYREKPYCHLDHIHQMIQLNGTE